MAASPIGMAAGLAGGIIGAINSGPSSAMTALNNQVQDFNKYMTAQAKSEGIDASTTFQQLMQPLQRIVSGGPNQAGWSQAQVNAFNTQQTQIASGADRNIKAQIGTMGQPGVVSGNNGSGVAQAEAAIESNKANAIAQGTISSDEAGRQEFNTAVGEEKALPGVFSTSNTANEQAANEQQKAETSQQNIDTAKRSASWQGILSKSLSGAGGTAIGGAVQNGIGNMSKDSTTLENVGNFGKGFFGSGITGNDASATQKAVNTPVATTTSTLPDELTASAF